MLASERAWRCIDIVLDKMGSILKWLRVEFYGSPLASGEFGSTQFRDRIIFSRTIIANEIPKVEISRIRDSSAVLFSQLFSISLEIGRSPDTRVYLNRDRINGR
jgi:hypothetical protein